MTPRDPAGLLPPHVPRGQQSDESDQIHKLAYVSNSTFTNGVQRDCAVQRLYFIVVRAKDNLLVKRGNMGNTFTSLTSNVKL